MQFSDLFIFITGLEQEEEALKDFNRAYDLMKEIQESYISDYAERSLYAGNSVINYEIRTFGIDLFKKLFSCKNVLLNLEKNFRIPKMAQ